MLTKTAVSGLGLSGEYGVMKAIPIAGQIVELMCSENECCGYNVLFSVVNNSTSVT